MFCCHDVAAGVCVCGAPLGAILCTLWVLSGPQPSSMMQPPYCSTLPAAWGWGSGARGASTCLQAGGLTPVGLLGPC